TAAYTTTELSHMCPDITCLICPHTEQGTGARCCTTTTRRLGRWVVHRSGEELGQRPLVGLAQRGAVDAELPGDVDPAATGGPDPHHRHAVLPRQTGQFLGALGGEG